MLCSDLKSPMWCHSQGSQGGEFKSWMNFGWKPLLMRRDGWRHVSHMPNMHDFTFHMFTFGRRTHIRAHLSSVLSILVSDTFFAFLYLCYKSYTWHSFTALIWRLKCLLDRWRSIQLDVIQVLFESAFSCLHQVTWGHLNISSSTQLLFGPDSTT